MHVVINYITSKWKILAHKIDKTQIYSGVSVGTIRQSVGRGSGNVTAPTRTNDPSARFPSTDIRRREY